MSNALLDVGRILRACHSELIFEFVRASGPGGQNVNKVATAAQLRFDLDRSAAIPEDARLRLRDLAGSRVTAEGVLIIMAKRYRRQDQNRQDAMERFDKLIFKALQEPKRRVRTMATAASQKKRMESKKKRGALKKTRQGFSFE